MLDDYEKIQNIAYRIISNQLKKERISHAYIIETNTNADGFNFAKAFAKTLLCPKKNTNLNNCGDCRQCTSIDNNNFIELKIIEPDGMWITKKQIDDLQNTFMKKAIIGNNKVYIINHAEKMKPNIIDSLLKFIEEPMEGIIAILVTDNVNNIIDTIVSRCQIVSLKRNNDIYLSDNMIDNIKKVIDNRKYSTIEINEEIINKIINFIYYYEKKGINALLYTKELWHDNFNDQLFVNFAISIMILFYREVLDYKINGQVHIFKDYMDIIQFINKKNTQNDLTNKISVIIDAEKKIKYNINLLLVVDKLIIELEKRSNND